MNRNLEHCPGLLLTDSKHPIPHMLPPHSDYIAAPLCGVEQQRKSKPRLGTNRVPRLVLCYLGLRPSVNAIRSNPRWLYALRRVIGAEALGNSEL